jgi:single-strand DNA-binding protein
MNKILLLGRLTADPEYKITEKGKKITYFRLAVNNGEKFNPLFIRTVAFDDLADRSFKSLQKGSQVFVEGRLDLQQNIDTKQNYYSVVAHAITFLKGTKELTNEKISETTELSSQSDAIIDKQMDDLHPSA